MHSLSIFNKVFRCQLFLDTRNGQYAHSFTLQQAAAASYLAVLETGEWKHLLDINLCVFIFITALFCHMTLISVYPSITSNIALHMQSAFPCR